MKIGIKTFGNPEIAEYFKDKVDFLEIMAISGKDYSFLEGYPLPIVVHAEHHGFGVNAADPGLFEKNLASIEFAIGLADRFGSKKIILHPGSLDNANCSVEQAIKFFQGLDSRILFENLPFIQEYICAQPLDVQDFLLKTHHGLCFDINHMIQTAMASNKDYFEMIQDFLKFNPAHYHIGGQNGPNPENTHLPFRDSTIDLKRILGMLPRDAEITLEVAIDIQSNEEDINFVRSLVG